MNVPQPVGYRTVHLDELEAVPWKGGRLTWRPVRGRLGIGAFGAAAFTATHSGDEVVEPHAESPDGRGQDELYFVARGRATFTVAGDEIDAPAGTFVFVEDPGGRYALALAAAGSGADDEARGWLAQAVERVPELADERGRTPSWRACSTRAPERAQAAAPRGPEPPAPPGARGRSRATSSKSPATRAASAGHA